MENRPAYVCWRVETFDHILSYKLRPWLHGCILLCVELFCFPFLHLFTLDLHSFSSPYLPLPSQDIIHLMESTWDGIHEGTSTTSLRFLEIILRFLRLEVSTFVFLSFCKMLFMNKLKFSSLFVCFVLSDSCPAFFLLIATTSNKNF